MNNKNIKVLVAILISILFIISASASTEDLRQNLKKQCGSTNIELSGCMYTDGNKDKYEKLPIGKQIMVSQDALAEPQRYVYFDLDDLTFQRAYTSINKNGETVVGMCHIGYVQTSSYKKQSGQEYYKVSSTNQSGTDLGIVYLSVYNPKSDKNCEKAYSHQVIFQNENKGYTTFLANSAGGNGGFKEIDTKGYSAYSDLICPKYFLYSSNLGTVQSWFYSDLEYVFTDAKDVEPETNWFKNFLRVDETGKIAGCLEQAVDGNEFSTECYEKIKTEKIDTFKNNCPEKLTDIKLDVTSYIQECAARYNSETNVDLESATYIRQQKEKWSKYIKDAAAEAINSCFSTALVNRCKLDLTQGRAVTEALKNSNCYLCDLGKAPESMDANGKCYSCRGSTNVTQYVWSANVPSGCGENTIPKEECYGTQTNKECRDCYNNTISGISSLNDTQKSCVVNLAKEANAATNAANEDTDTAYNEDESAANAANQATMDEIWNNSNRYGTFYLPGLSESDFGPDNQKCNEILGKNGIKIVIGLINAVRVIGVIIAIANGMITLIPAVVSKDADGLKKAEKKLVIMAVVLAVIGILPTIVYLIGGIFDFDLSCIFKI